MTLGILVVDAEYESAVRFDLIADAESNGVPGGQYGEPADIAPFELVDCQVPGGDGAVVGQLQW